MSKDLEFFSEELLAVLRHANEKASEKKRIDKMQDSLLNVELPDNFTFSEEELKKLDSLKEIIAEELLDTGLTVADIKTYGRRLTSTNATTKAEYCKKLAEALCNPNSFFVYYTSFNENGKILFEKLAFEPFVTKDDLVKYAPVNERYSYYHYDAHNVPMAFAFTMDWSKFAFLPFAIKKCLQIMLSKFHEKKELTEEEFKKSEGFFSLQEGLEFFINLPQIIQVLTDTNFFEREIGSVILKGTLSKIEKITEFTKFTKKADFSASKNFFSSIDKQIEKIHNARVTLALSFLSFTINILKSTKTGKDEFLSLQTEPQKLLKRLVEIFFTTREFIFDKKFIYPHASVRYYSEREIKEHRADTFNKLFQLIKENPADKPVDFEEYVSLLSEKGMFPFFSSGVEATVSYSSAGYSPGHVYSDRIYLRNEYYYYGLVHNQACTNLLLTLASIGLFEINWELPFKTPPSKADFADWENAANLYRFGKISHIKMTPLGAYVFNLTDKIQIEGVKQFAPPSLDESSLIIHIDEGDKSMQIFLESFCIPLSHTLYKADVLRLKKKCTTPDEVTAIFSTLSTRAKGNLPKIWQNLKNDILESFVSLKQETEWIVFPLEKQKASFLREIEQLCRSEICVKMAGKRVAVKKEKFAQFKRRLEAAGFKVL